MINNLVKCKTFFDQPFFIQNMQLYILIFLCGLTIMKCGYTRLTGPFSLMCQIKALLIWWRICTYSVTVREAMRCVVFHRYILYYIYILLLLNLWTVYHSCMALSVRLVFHYWHSFYIIHLYTIYYIYSHIINTWIPCKLVNPSSFISWKKPIFWYQQEVHLALILFGKMYFLLIHLSVKVVFSWNRIVWND